jgi:quercetin dioxygenase-like cupin family protein
MVEHAADDATRVFTSDDKEWIPVPLIPQGEAWIKVITVDEERRTVVFKFKFGPDTVLPAHTHKCHAIAYTISGEWEYEGLKLPEGALAYEPVDSVHTPSSGPGAEMVVTLRSETDDFLINHMADGTDIPFDLNFFKQLEQLRTKEEVEALAVAMTNGG